MAKLLPKISPSEIQNSSERKVAEELIKQLPDGVLVIHSFNWLSEQKSGRLIEGECDFVLIDPSQGILFIEVKGGYIKYDQEVNAWQRTLRAGQVENLNKDPTGQVRNSMYVIVDTLKEKLRCEQLPFTYGYALVFPDGKFMGTVPSDLSSNLIIDASKIDKIQSAINKAFKCFRRGGQQALKKQDFMRVKDALLPMYAIIPVMWRSIEDQEDKLHRMTEEQMQILQTLSKQRLAVIEGGAGTGKTLLALAKAQEIAKSGKRVLLVCYNRLLGEWLKSKSVEELEDNLVVTHYHKLVSDLCTQTNTEFHPKGMQLDNHFWMKVVPNKLIEACDKLSVDEKFDAVIVDEGQDFHEDWWLSLEFLFQNSEEKYCYFIFLDPNQNLFVARPSLPSELNDRLYPLNTNCRNTRQIAEHCASLIDIQVDLKPHSAEGEEPNVYAVDSVSEAIDIVNREVKRLCTPTAEGLRKSQVAVLGSNYIIKEIPARFGKTIPSTDRVDDWKADKGVLAVSTYQFKGLESDVVIVLTKPVSSEDSKARTENYVTRTRAKHLLIVIEINALG